MKYLKYLIVIYYMAIQLSLYVRETDIERKAI